MESERLQRLRQATEPLRDQLKNHPIYSEIKTLDDLNIFMEHHVFAVWDFMSVLKVLQQKLTSIHIPWIPLGNPNTRYLINQIVTEEESGIDQDGKRTSHFELYVKAMEQAGGDTKPVNDLLKALKEGNNFSLSLDNCDLPDAARSFIKNTIETSIQAEVYVQAAVFTFGRRGLVPDKFRKFIEEFDQQHPAKVSIFKYYLNQRATHKDIDQSEDAHQMMIELCGEDEKKWTEATNAINRSLLGRVQLWDAILKKIQAHSH